MHTRWHVREVNHASNSKAVIRIATVTNQSIGNAQAMGHESRLPASLLEQITTARDGGATYDELIALVDTLTTT
jgi:hypothetical protein